MTNKKISTPYSNGEGLATIPYGNALCTSRGAQPSLLHHVVPGLVFWLLKIMTWGRGVTVVAVVAAMLTDTVACVAVVVVVPQPVGN